MRRPDELALERAEQQMRDPRSREPSGPAIRRSRPDARKPSLLLPTAVLDEARAEARRLGSSLSGLFQIAWRISRDRIRELPGPR